VRHLLETEISEIADGSVIIKGIAREPGYPTKICVDTKDKNIDSVGACVGTRGVRIKNLVRELNGEKIDVKPAILKDVSIDEVEHKIYFEVAESDLAVAIGKRGLNAKLTSKMMNWRLDISKESIVVDNFDDKDGADDFQLGRCSRNHKGNCAQIGGGRCHRCGSVREC
jgi:N utilization substance protein A